MRLPLDTTGGSGHSTAVGTDKQNKRNSFCQTHCDSTAVGTDKQNKKNSFCQTHCDSTAVGTDKPKKRTSLCPTNRTEGTVFVRHIVIPQL